MVVVGEIIIINYNCIAKHTHTHTQTFTMRMRVEKVSFGMFAASPNTDMYTDIFSHMLPYTVSFNVASQNIYYNFER